MTKPFFIPRIAASLKENLNSDIMPQAKRNKRHLKLYLPSIWSELWKNKKRQLHAKEAPLDFNTAASSARPQLLFGYPETRELL